MALFLLFFTIKILAQPAIPMTWFPFEPASDWWPAFSTSSGSAPLIATSNLVSVPASLGLDWWTPNVLLLDSTNSSQALLEYAVYDTNWVENISYSPGTLLIYFSPNWQSVDQGGGGPGSEFSYLICGGDFSSNSPNGLFRIYFDAGGSNVYIGGLSNGVSTVYASATISWSSNSWHCLGFEYTYFSNRRFPGTTIYIDGAKAATGGAVAIQPALGLDSNGLFCTNVFAVGSDGYGFEQARGAFWNMIDWSSEYGGWYTNGWESLSNALATWQAGLGGGGGFGALLGAGLGMSAPVGYIPGVTYNTNYSDYSNFSLTIGPSTSGTQVVLTVQNSLSNLTYTILTNSVLNPNLADWGVWQTLTASNSVIVSPSYNIGSNAMFFASQLALITGTNQIADWWQMNFFGQLGIDPNGNPTGDGINNLQKFLLGLNPTVAYVSPLIISPPAGAYTSPPPITIYSLAGAPIIYTTNGTTPSSTNGFPATSGTILSNVPNGSFTLEAWESGPTTNVPLVANYTIVPALPTFSLPSGIYGSAITLQISSTTTNAIVRYTTSGTAPTSSSPQIQSTDVITIATNQTVEAAAWLNGVSSGAASANYIITGAALNDNFSNAFQLSGAAGTTYGTTLGATTEVFENNNPDFFNLENGHSVWYKWTAPSNGNVFVDYSASQAFIFDAYYLLTTNTNPTNLLAANYSSSPDYTSSILAATNGVTYYFRVTEYWGVAPGTFQASWSYETSAPMPIFSPDTGSYQTAQSVFIVCNDPIALVYYTTNGVDPTTNDLVALPDTFVVIWTNTTLKAAAWRSGLNESAVKTATYVINPSITNPTLTVSSPVLSPVNTAFTNSLAITLSCTNTGATIYYTLNGYIPTTSDFAVTNGATITITNSELVTANAWATNMNPSPVAVGIYAMQGVDSTSDGIPDTAALAIGANPFLSDANAVNSTPYADGLNNFQVYQNPTVLIGVNYSSLNDGVPDSWKIANGYATNASASSIAANGQTLFASYQGGYNPNDPNARSSPLGTIDFHMVHGPTNSMVLVIDRVLSNVVDYLLYCTPASGPTVLKEIPVTQALAVTNGGFSRYFPLPNPQLSPGSWVFTLQAVDNLGNASKMSPITFSRNVVELMNDAIFFDPGAAGSGQATWTDFFTDVPVEVAGYTNNSLSEETILVQALRATSEAWSDISPYNVPVIYNANVQPFTTNLYWGTPWTFQFDRWDDLVPVGSASYFPPFCASGVAALDCADYDTQFGWSFNQSLTPFQITEDFSGAYITMPDSTWGLPYTVNPVGLTYLSMKISVSNQTPMTLYPGQSIPLWTNGNPPFEVALETETPTLETVGYYFDGRQYPLFDPGYGITFSSSAPPIVPPGTMPGWSEYPYQSPSGYPVTIAMTNPVIVGQVGRPVNLQAWSGVIAVHANGTPITNQVYFLDQDFDQAYLCDPLTGDVPRTSALNYNGAYKINTNTAVPTGILSPNLNFAQTDSIYPSRSADFTPTQIGKVIITTKPDASGNYGEVVVYVIDMQVDANHDGVIDNRDLTSVDNPMVFWVNNNFDRSALDDDDGVYYDDDVATNDPTYSPSYGTPGVPTPDYNYQAADGTPIIPNIRDLQDYARLWIPGLSNLLVNLPDNYAATLQWRNNSGAAIRLFKASETNGGTNYLFNQMQGLLQSLWTSYPCYGFVSPSQTISFDQIVDSSSVPIPSDYFIFCGAAAGNDELVLQINNQFGGEVGEASVFLNLKDIKKMYERWSVGDNASVVPNNIVTNAGDDGVGPFQYPYTAQTDSNTPYILYVHGWNMPTWEKDRFAESAFKRLYWQGYQGRFGLFRWPTGSGFAGISTLATSPAEKDNYDLSEYQAWQSATGLFHKLTVLNIQYPGKVYMLAHSMGNVVAGEALRLAGTNQVVNTYAATQAAITAHTYDPTVTNYSFAYAPFSYSADTPNIYGNWFATNKGNGAGQIISLYNTNDYALQRSVWQLDQLFKPDKSVTEGATTWNYEYNGATNDPPPWNNFSKQFLDGQGSVHFNIVTNIYNRYEVMALAAQPYTTALGATPNVQHVTRSVDLSGIWPRDAVHPTHPFDEHFYHSAEFRGDYWQEQYYWSELLGPDAFHFK
jgi:hypothetical protein